MVKLTKTVILCLYVVKIDHNCNSMLMYGKNYHNCNSKLIYEKKKRSLLYFKQFDIKNSLF